ncbi:hypothetical protein C8R43DRAFT_153335 [Mycena crocata]|nr:hypothetical protein C8R43DRAFT_153335 [Mycena crocata]
MSASGSSTSAGTPTSSGTGASLTSSVPSSSFLRPDPSFPANPGPSGSGMPPPQCNDPQGCSSQPPPPATLYLYTFLSTLIILLLVSAGIIARSVVLRRRQQLAIANGTWIPPTVRLRENYTTRPRPIMFDAYAVPGKGGLEERWNAMQPFSACDIVPPQATKAPVPLPLPLPQADSIRTPLRDAARDEIRSVVRLHNPFRRRPPPAPPPAPPPVEQACTPPPVEPDTRQVHVAFLVSMPSLPPQNSEDLPYIEFGVLEAGVVDRGKTSEQSEGWVGDLATKA